MQAILLAVSLTTRFLVQYLLLHFGYAFLVLGLIIEGDATLVAAMILASAGTEYFSMRWVIGIALGVTVGGNELMYEIGALGRMRSLLAHSKHRQRVSRWLHSSRSGFSALLFSRFMWGFRLIIPLAAGMLHIRRRRFSLTNLVGGVIWVALLAYFGVALQQLFVLLHDDLMRYQSHIAVALFLLGIVLGLGTIPWQITRRGRRRPAPGHLGLDTRDAGPVVTRKAVQLPKPPAAAALPTAPPAWSQPHKSHPTPPVR
ncbi:MAG TPA: DedA family protein [Terriglobales bacterium]